MARSSSEIEELQQSFEKEACNLGFATINSIYTKALAEALPLNVATDVAAIRLAVLAVLHYPAAFLGESYDVEGASSETLSDAVLQQVLHAGSRGNLVFRLASHMWSTGSASLTPRGLRLYSQDIDILRNEGLLVTADDVLQLNPSVYSLLEKSIEAHWTQNRTGALESIKISTASEVAGTIIREF